MDVTAPRSHPLPPAELGLEVSDTTTQHDDGWLVRLLGLPAGLDGPPGILQGGLAAGLTASLARFIDPFGAPLTGLHARLHAPTLLELPVEVRMRPTDVVAHYDVELHQQGVRTVSARVELAGREPTAHVADLLDLATVPLPPPRPQQAYPTCWICGPSPTHLHGQRLHPRYHRDDAVVVPWVADEELGDEHGVVSPAVVAAALDCPTVWAVMDAVEAAGGSAVLLGGYHLTVLRDAPVMEPLRTVARLDRVTGRKLEARAALVDEDGITYAVAAALQVAVDAVPTREQVLSRRRRR